jgi:hypothetical protein
LGLLEQNGTHSPEIIWNPVHILKRNFPLDCEKKINWLSFLRASEIGSAPFSFFLQPKIFCKPSNIDVALIKGRRGSI